jgi:hypothetical protein
VAEYLALTHAGTVVTPTNCGVGPMAGVRSSLGRRSVARACFERITQDMESFGTAVYEPFMAHD